MVNRIRYNIKQALTHLNRSRGMTLASVFAITAMMLILGLFFVLSVNLNLFTEMIKSDYDEVELFLRDDVTTEQAQAVMDEVDKFDGVEETLYRTKDDAMDIMKKRWGENGYLLDSLGENPLPNSVLVKVEDIDAANTVIDKSAKLDGVEDVRYYKETVEKLTKVTNSIQVGALILMAFLIVVSVVVVANTIKLTVFARAKEIEIMKYVGATNWFIRGPFLVEGIIIGVISSLISAGITFGIYSRVVAAVGLQVMTMFSSPLVPAGYLSLNLIVIFLAMGVSVGACGSIISMRRFLDT